MELLTYTPGFDMYEMLFGKYGLSRLGSWQTIVPAWLREVSSAMRQLIDQYTEYIHQRCIDQRRREMEYWMTPARWGDEQPEHRVIPYNPGATNWYWIQAMPGTVIKEITYGWERPHSGWESVKKANTNDDTL
jgi:hypothetical protein